MNKQDPLSNPKARKFLFDVHNFDEKKDAEAEPEAPPPPPSFSEAELDSARRAAYEDGRKAGNAEAQASFERQMADTLGIIRDHFRILYDEEERRARTFEKEAVQLAYTVFDKSFPMLNDRLGLDDVKSMLSKILESLQTQPEIIIEVPSPYIEAIQTHLNTTLRPENGQRCLVRANDTLTPGSCRMSWVNGSAARHGHKIAEQIRAKIEQVLAEPAILADNNNEEATPTPPSHGDQT